VIVALAQERQRLVVIVALSHERQRLLVIVVLARGLLRRKRVPQGLRERWAMLARGLLREEGSPSRPKGALGPSASSSRTCHVPRPCFIVQPAEARYQTGPQTLQSSRVMLLMLLMRLP